MPYGFESLNDIQRISDTVKRSESALDLTGQPNARNYAPASDTILARLVTKDATTQWKVTTWKQVHRKVDGTYEDVTGGLTDTSGKYPAHERNKATTFQVGATTGDVVLLKREPCKQSDGTISFVWTFAIGGASTPSIAPNTTFAVRLQQDGGSGGSATAACNYTYAVMDMNYTSLGTGKTPLVYRPWGLLNAAQYGLAFFDTNNALNLLVAFEQPVTAVKMGCQ